MPEQQRPMPWDEPDEPEPTEVPINPLKERLARDKTQAALKAQFRSRRQERQLRTLAQHRPVVRLSDVARSRLPEAHPLRLDLERRAEVRRAKETPPADPEAPAPRCTVSSDGLRMACRRTSAPGGRWGKGNEATLGQVFDGMGVRREEGEEQ
jgi:hypothetical protein